MRIVLHKDFHKCYWKLRQGEQQKADTRIQLFQKNPFHPVLNNHALHGVYQGYRSINITGDLRAIYEEVNSDTVHFIALGTHQELYT